MRRFVAGPRRVPAVLQPPRIGAGIFTGQSLPCGLGLDCTSAFDEGLGATLPARSTPADTPLGLGEEYRVPIGGDSELKVTTSWGSQSTALTGTAGYSFCAAGSQSAPCPFDLGSFEAEATSTITPKITCVLKRFEVRAGGGRASRGGCWEPSR